MLKDYLNNSDFPIIFAINFGLIYFFYLLSSKYDSIACNAVLIFLILLLCILIFVCRKFYIKHRLDIALKEFNKENSMDNQLNSLIVLLEEKMKSENLKNNDFGLRVRAFNESLLKRFSDSSQVYKRSIHLLLDSIKIYYENFLLYIEYFNLNSISSISYIEEILDIDKKNEEILKEIDIFTKNIVTSKSYTESDFDSLIQQFEVNNQNLVYIKNLSKGTPHD